MDLKLSLFLEAVLAADRAFAATLQEYVRDVVDTSAKDGSSDTDQVIASIELLDQISRIRLALTQKTSETNNSSTRRPSPTAI